MLRTSEAPAPVHVGPADCSSSPGTQVLASWSSGTKQPLALDVAPDIPQWPVGLGRFSSSRTHQTTKLHRRSSVTVAAHQPREHLEYPGHTGQGGLCGVTRRDPCNVLRHASGGQPYRGAMGTAAPAGNTPPSLRGRLASPPLTSKTRSPVSPLRRCSPFSRVWKQVLLQDDRHPIRQMKAIRLEFFVRHRWASKDRADKREIVTGAKLAGISQTED